MMNLMQRNPASESDDDHEVEEGDQMPELEEVRWKIHFPAQNYPGSYISWI